MSDVAHTYRPDVDGLRAIAIIPVVTFHVFPWLAPGGFVGVDVFFVISGYLISQTILEGLAENAFTFRHFYARRIRRIFPALLLVLGTCLAWGWFGLYAADYAQLGKHVAGGAAFAANLVLWSEAGYFDPASEAKPLLHLWSLGIEEQFYLFWPLAVYTAWTRRYGVVTLVAGLGLASFLVNAIQVRTDEPATFYSPITRLWELLLGGGLASITLPRSGGPSAFAEATADKSGPPVVALVAAPPLREAVAGVGLASIAAAIFVFDADTSFPGWRAALPAGGALLVVAAGPQAWLNRRVLAARPLVWIGLISYPLYLWHWPLLSFARMNAGPPSVTTLTGLVALSVVLAWGTYAVIEHPIRFQRRGRGIVVALTMLMAISGVAGYVTFAREGFAERPINRSDQAHFLQYYERLRQRGLREAYRAECDFMDWQTEETRSAIDSDCTRPGRGGTVFLWGDSHAQALSYGLRRLLPADVRLAQVTTSACPPRLHEPDPLALGGRCSKANAHALERIAAIKPAVVLLAQILAHEAIDWTTLAGALRTLGARRVVLVGPMPQWLPSLPVVITSHYWDREFTRVDRGLKSEVFATDNSLRERFEGSDLLDYVSLIDALCGTAATRGPAETGCLAGVPDTDRQLMVVDNGHLSPAGSLYVAATILRPFVLSR